MKESLKSRVKRLEGAKPVDDNMSRVLLVPAGNPDLRYAMVKDWYAQHPGFENTDGGPNLLVLTLHRAIDHFEKSAAKAKDFDVRRAT